MHHEIPNIFVRRFPISTVLLIDGAVCRVHAIVTETTDLNNGDQIEEVSINEIIADNGQTILPCAMSYEQFRTLVQNVKKYIPEI